MSDPKISISKTLIHEGGYTNNPADPGHATNMGITQADLPGRDLHTLTVAEATEYYLEHYVKPLYSQINSQAILDKLIDSGILFGIGEAVGILQMTLNIKVDHQFGEETLAAVNEADEATLLQGYKTNLVTHAFNVVSVNPAEKIFLKGWSDRINS
jgi:lysozyme family protein